jgi:hypothetical protein
MYFDCSRGVRTVEPRFEVNSCHLPKNSMDACFKATGILGNSGKSSAGECPFSASPVVSAAIEYLRAAEQDQTTQSKN